MKFAVDECSCWSRWFNDWNDCKGHIIIMVLDMRKLELKYIVDGVEYSPIRIKPGEYRAVVNLYQSGDAVTLLPNTSECEDAK